MKRYRGRLLLAVLMSIAVVIAAPFIGELRTALSRALGTNFARVLNTAIAIVAIGVFTLGLARIRDRRVLRGVLLLIALAIAFFFGRGSSSSSAVTRAVERFHFVEYGMIALLFSRAYGVTAAGLAMAALSAFMVGIAEESLQWFVPDRIGELRDVLLNSVAIACGLLVVVAVEPVLPRAWRFAPGDSRRVARLTALALLALGLFVRVVHLGTEVGDGEVTFRSRYAPAELEALSAAREASWRAVRPPQPAPALSREDQYLTEALWHVQARNTAWEAAPVTAWGENRILEKYFSPALGLGHNWSAAQRADGDRRAAGRPPVYSSRAEKLPLWTWPKPLFWLGLVALLTPFILAGWGRNPSRLDP